ncbi:tetracycline-efflux transporter [Aspergillus flavus]|nr:tetracycline-efflux transporter [Aspergillus flavus]
MGLSSQELTEQYRLEASGGNSPHTDFGHHEGQFEEPSSYSLGSARLEALASAPLIGNHRRSQSADTDDSNNGTDHDDTLDTAAEKSEKPASWSSLPRKGQLAILTLARLSEGLTQSSLQAYLFHQLKSFDSSLPDSTISAQVGIVLGIFPAAQFLTSAWWGRLADANCMGRKRVLLIGLLGTMISYLGFGFSRSLATAVIFRTLGGLLNSNFGVMSTLISEITVEKKFQSRAFLLLPMCFNLGVIIGPTMGGSLADPVQNFPRLFGPHSIFGGTEGVWWMQRWPFALPNILSTIFILISFLAVFFGLDETHEIARYRHDAGRELGRRLAKAFSGGRAQYTRPPSRATDDNYILRDTHLVSAPSSPTFSDTSFKPKLRQRRKLGQLWTRNVLLTLLCHFLLAFHTNAVQTMTFIFLPTPRVPTESHTGIFHFGGGLGLPSAQVGLATAIIGLTGLPLQIFAYPRLQGKLGTLVSLRTFVPFSPVSYILMPFLVLLPNILWVFWPALTFVILLQAVSRTFVLPATSILVNNCVGDPASLGTIHGVAQSISSAARTLAPVISGWGLAAGLRNNIVGAMWWALGMEAFIGWLMLWCISEGKGIDPVKEKMEEDDDDH